MCPPKHVPDSIPVPVAFQEQYLLLFKSSALRFLWEKHMMPFDSQWLNSNHFRSYPLREDASLQSTDGYVLPDEILLDLVLVSFPTAKLPL